ncbi:lipid-A-disaccharide synthase [Synechococcales cyanobacterium C]|uniref:Lipid-A-disaccharide synthase n=1 Tax=Petrachloros mirabilis ULC683 TaxID=2781853 RepID=A0A8K1ZYM2_9CYAN|nr:lipid-A-disaccharide synthase [Petrachloros mirabilis]NCJ07248.1 lipid-A-disaccharide synthase [Petrachloros mirabilis ULC683]
MSRPLRLLISAGEVSGDLQGSLLIQALVRQAAHQHLDLEIWALGGERMAAAGARLIVDTRALGAIGWLESLRFGVPVLQQVGRIRRTLAAFPPDGVVLIDYVGVNLGLGRYLKRRFQVPIVYYIAPQEWVWSRGMGTTRQIVSLADAILAIFPEEARYYAQQGARVTWVGHPLLDALEAVPPRAIARQQLGIAAEEVAIALLPASRHQELRHVLPPIWSAAQQIQRQVPKAHFWIPVAQPQYAALLSQAIAAYGLHATLTEDPSLTLAAADLALSKSGTANLEAALLGVPQVVIYRFSPISAWLYRRILQMHVPFICPVNLVTFEAIVPELLQEQATPERIAHLALTLLQNPTARQTLLRGYARMRAALGEPGAIDRAAALICQIVQQRSAC